MGEEVWPFILPIRLLLICIETCTYSKQGVGAHRQLTALGQVTRGLEAVTIEQGGSDGLSV